ncbi:MAG: hypothetical protein ABFD81_12390 [Syntrophaceae bacterium]
MGETKVRNEIEELKADLLSINKELSIRFANMKEDGLIGLKILAALVAAYYGLKIARLVLRIILGMLWSHKIALALIGALYYLGSSGTSTAEDEKGPQAA